MTAYVCLRGKNSFADKDKGDIDREEIEIKGL